MGYQRTVGGELFVCHVQWWMPTCWLEDISRSGQYKWLNVSDGELGVVVLVGIVVAEQWMYLYIPE